MSSSIPQVVYEASQENADAPSNITDANLYTFSLVPAGPTKKSKYWQYFKLYDLQQHPNKRHKARCDACGEDIKIEKGVAGLQNHVKRKHEELWAELNHPEAGSATESAMPQGNPTNMPVKIKSPIERKNEFLEFAVQWVISTNQPLNAVEARSFRQMTSNMMSTSKEDALILTEANIRDKILDYGRIVREAVKRELADKKFSVRTDLWASESNADFAALTGHYSEGGSLKRVFIDFAVYQGTSPEQSISEDFVQRFRASGLSSDNVVACTTDATGSMINFGEILQEEFGIPHLFCVGHNLHLNAKLAFDYSNLPDSEHAVTAARTICKHFSESAQAASELKMIQGQLDEYKDSEAVKTIQDVVRRWWSTYAMLKRLHHLRGAINTLIENQQVNLTQLTDTQVAALDGTEEALGIVSFVQKHLEDDQCPTLSMVPTLLNSIQDQYTALVQDERQPQYVRNLATKLLRDFTEQRYKTLERKLFYENYERGDLNRPLTLHTLVLLAAALDPRTKSLRGIPDEDHEKIWGLVEAKMLELRENSAEPSIEPPNNDNDGISSPATLSRASVLFRTFFSSLVDDEDQLRNEDDGDIKDEIRRYQREPRLAINESNYKEKALQVMPWWEKRRYKFPRLYVLAQRILPIPAAEAPSELLFSLASRALTKTRKGLDPTVISAIIMIQENRQLLDKWYHAITDDDPYVHPYSDLTDEDLDEAIAIYVDD